VFLPFFIIALLGFAMYAVLRRCAILGSLVTPTPKYSLTSGVVSTICIGLNCFWQFYILEEVGADRLGFSGLCV
jgi:hypothetical protein